MIEPANFAIERILSIKVHAQPIVYNSIELQYNMVQIEYKPSQNVSTDALTSIDREGFSVSFCLPPGPITDFASVPCKNPQEVELLAGRFPDHGKKHLPVDAFKIVDAVPYNTPTEINE